MEIAPANHQLAVCTYEFLCSGRHPAVFASRSVVFWAGSLLANSIFQCFPAAPESAWLRAADILGQLQMQGLSESFHAGCLSAPFLFEALAVLF
ncbi:unnamed protein product [Spirodela intermedia]|uniref:Uncharacterized protein n=1 Tax=Spirodela intermedia TaxID=51605 RepID=A0A7I8IC64_SPIIN|nr:unnamed protein product [Spirodela intermedia]CAA6654933.1 unnamed protein product [Spirodela intermedia]